MNKLFDKLHLELFESLKVGLAINDMDGNLVYVNQAYADLIGYEKSEIYKLSYWDITPQKYNSEEEIQLKYLAEKNSYGPYDKEYIHKNGYFIPVRLNGNIIQIDQVSYIWSTVEDTYFSKSKAVSSELEQLGSLVEESINEIFIFDFATLKFLYANEAARKNIGYTMDELYKMTPIDIKPNFDTTTFNDYLIPLKENKINKLEFQTIHERKDGTLYHSEIRLQKGNYKGKPSYIAYITDITEKKNIELEQQKVLEKLHQALNFQQIIQDNAAYSIIATNLDGIITNFNKAAEKMLGYSAENIINKENPGLFHDINQVIKRSKEFSKILGKNIEPGFQTFTCLSDAGLPNEYEWTYINKDGTRFPVILSITKLQDSTGQTTGYLGIGRDITETKEREAELQKAKQEAEKALAIRRDFLANMSHEIRTPMNGIIGMTGLLLEDIKDKESLDKLESINKSSQSLLEIINDILDISKIESGKIVIEKNVFDPREMIKNITDIHKAAINKKDVNISYQVDHNIPPAILADELRLKQILNNLLSNAVKFTLHGEIKIDLTYTPIKKNRFYLKCSVRDSGIGIKAEDQEKIFKSFSQGDSSTTRLFGGTGLGLSITKNLVQLMSGKIWVESQTGQGTTFHFKIPVTKADHSHIESPKEVIINDLPLHLNILVVEDGIINQKVICSFLKKLNYHPLIANNGQEALDMLKNNKIDLIFMDCHMPILDGFKATEEIIKQYKNNAPYIVAVTASAMSEDIQRCYSVGMNDFISKPISKEALINSLKSLKLKNCA